MLTNTILKKINTEQKAYFLGFLFADGNIFKKSIITRDTSKR